MCVFSSSVVNAYLPFCRCALKIVSMNTKNAASAEAEGAALSVNEAPVESYLRRAGLTTDPEMVKFVRSSARRAYMVQFGQRCRAAREAINMDVSEAAAKMGVHRNTIWNIERGDSLPDAFDLEVMASIYGTTTPLLLAGAVSALPGASKVAKSLKAVQADGYIYVPEFDVHVSAGNGFFNDLEMVTTMRPFDEKYIRGELGISHNDLALIKVVGQSMEPDLHSRDTTLVDLQDRDVLADGIHILRLDGALLIKKAQRLPGRVLRISSSNQNYQPFDIQAQEDVERDFAILGRVRWAGVTFS
jgi:phage repressor protein C with HTH and peptisase S24 domain/ribosome-binding protein aMBF1 (putative translation factor)